MFNRLEKWGLFSYANSTVVGIKSSLESQPQNKEKRNLSIRENCIHSLAAFNSFPSSRPSWITDEKVFFFFSSLPSVCRVQLRENSSGRRANVHHKSGWLHRQPLAPGGGIQIGRGLLNFFFFFFFRSFAASDWKCWNIFPPEKEGKNERNKQRGKKLKRAETAHQVSKPLVWLSGLCVYRKNSTRRTQKHSSVTNWKEPVFFSETKSSIFSPNFCLRCCSSLTSTFPIATIEQPRLKIIQPTSGLWLVSYCLIPSLYGSGCDKFGFVWQSAAASSKREVLAQWWGAQPPHFIVSGTYTLHEEDVLFNARAQIPLSWMALAPSLWNPQRGKEWGSGWVEEIEVDR